ncbi:MAG TPA: PQQ-binding-like beta-propeller repeat protein [Vicinamibacterales bacterium]|nr:PQQ-binding-like beta-propeller repeat protein [Vicinamibacterales bacterium]
MTRRVNRRGTLVLTLALGTVFSAVLFVGAQQPPAPTTVRGNVPGEWRYWGGDAWSTRYSSLDQINASNFSSLKVAWQWDAKSAGAGEDEYYRTTPLYANGRIFTVASSRRAAFAIDPANGQTLWKYELDEGIRWQKAPRRFAGRGLAYWSQGNEERVILVTPGYHMVLLDAKTGKPDPKFGKNGVVDLMDGLGLPLVPLAVDEAGPLVYSDVFPYRQAKPGETWDPVKKIGADGTIGIDPKLGQIAASSPAIVVNNVVVVGNSSIHGYYPVRVRNIPGYIRGFDIRTGKQLWKFNLVPQPGEFGADTWKNGSKVGDEGVGKNDAWAPYSADPDLGLVYIPVGMPLMDEYGGHRPGDNLYGNSLVALDVKTGQRKWHFQMVHHDIWDYDTPMAPNLLDVTINGQRRRIIAQTTKQGFMYVFDRTNGQPIWPIVEREVPQSDVPGEVTSKTQPIPTKPVPYSQQGLSESELIDYSPAIKEAALTLAKKCRMGPHYIPASRADDPNPQPGHYHCSWYAPGASGGVNIDGGAAADPETGLIYVGGQSGLGTIEVQKDPCSEFRFSTPRDNCGNLGAPDPPPGYVPRGGGAGRGAGGGGGGGGGGAAAGGGGGGAAAGAAGAGAAGAGAAGGQRAGGGAGGGRGGGPGVACADVAGARAGTSSCGGVSILKPREVGGITAYDMKSGDKAWWIPNGYVWTTPTTTDPIFAGVTLPPQGSGRGQPQVITTKSLVIFGTGRGGGVATEPKLFATDKATGKQVGAVTIPLRTSAVPMTFLHQNKQYIVFAVGSGANTALVALTLPSATESEKK